MAGVTSTLMAAGSLGLTASQMVQANKDKQKAENAAKLAATAIKGASQQNAFEALQAPDIASYAQQANLQAQAQSVQALQGMGPEGAAMIANIGQGARSSNLQAAQSQAQINYQRDTAQAQAGQQINRDKYFTEIGLEKSRLEGAQLDAASADAAKNQAISGMFGAAGQIAGGLGEAIPLYGKQKSGGTASASALGASALGAIGAPQQQVGQQNQGGPQGFGTPVQNAPQGFDWMWNPGTVQGNI